jgi:hypothetical protein
MVVVGYWLVLAYWLLKMASMNTTMTVNDFDRESKQSAENGGRYERKCGIKSSKLEHRQAFCG